MSAFLDVNDMFGSEGLKENRRKIKALQKGKIWGRTLWESEISKKMGWMFD